MGQGNTVYYLDVYHCKIMFFGHLLYLQINHVISDNTMVSWNMPSISGGSSDSFTVLKFMYHDIYSTLFFPEYHDTSMVPCPKNMVVSWYLFVSDGSVSMVIFNWYTNTDSVPFIYIKVPWYCHHCAIVFTPPENISCKSCLSLF